MADPQVSAPETASVHLELTVISLPKDLLTGPFGRPRSVLPQYTPLGPSSDAWRAVDSVARIPIGDHPIQQPDMPAIEILKPLRRGVDEAGQRNVDSLNQVAFSNFQSHLISTPISLAPITELPAIETLRPLQGAVDSLNRLAISYILNPAPTAQPSHTFPALVEDPLAAQPPTVFQCTMAASSVARPTIPEQSNSRVQHADIPTGINSSPMASRLAAEPSPTQPRFYLADQAAFRLKMQAQMSQDSVIDKMISPASRAASLPRNAEDTLPTPINSPERSRRQISKLSIHTIQNATLAIADALSALNEQPIATVTTTSALPQHAQPSLLVSRVESPSNNDPNASIVPHAGKTLKRKLNAEEISSQDRESRRSNTSESDSDSNLSSQSAGLVRNPITGRFRQRIMLDDSPQIMRAKYRQQWNDLHSKTRVERGPIEGYEDGDSDFELSEWEDAKMKRRRYL
jgi:hypothetical protein